MIPLCPPDEGVPPGFPPKATFPLRNEEDGEGRFDSMSLSTSNFRFVHSLLPVGWAPGVLRNSVGYNQSAAAMDAVALTVPSVARRSPFNQMAGVPLARPATLSPPALSGSRYTQPAPESATSPGPGAWKLRAMEQPGSERCPRYCHQGHRPGPLLQHTCAHTRTAMFISTSTCVHCKPSPHQSSLLTSTAGFLLAGAFGVSGRQKPDCPGPHTALTPGQPL